MDGEAVKELATRFRAPMMLGSHLAYPNDWKVVDPATIAGPSPVVLDVYTLGALRDYLTANRDELDLAHVVVHVVSPQIVRLHGPLNAASRAREQFVSATALNLTDGFLDKFLALETFIIGLQSRFQPSDERTRLLQLFSNVKSEAVKTSSDDGIGQIITTRAGNVFVSDVPVPNPITLLPYRTFREVRQPSSPFVLRLQAGQPGGLPSVGLFEADGGAWRLDAVAAIRGWLAQELPAGVSVLA